MKENEIETSNDIDYGTISLRKRGKSIIKIGNKRLGGTDVKIEVSTKFVAKETMEMLIEY